MDIIYYLKGLSEGYAYQSKDADFEVQHLLDVERAVLQLCKSRHLSAEKGLIMAYSHDLGRLKAGVVGKAHSKVSAKLLKELLIKRNFNTKEIKTLCKGVRRHNQKEKIHGPYAELIKDADSLAHAWESLVERDDYFEQVRVITAHSGAPLIKVANRQDWQFALRKTYDKILKCISDDIAFSAHSEFWVHDLRVAIRKMRSILWVLKHHKESGSAEALLVFDRRLEKMAKALENVRILQVALRKLALDKETYSEFQQKVVAEFTTMSRQYDKLFLGEGMEQLLNIVIEALPDQMDRPCEKLLFRTLKRADSVALNQSKKLHILRIYTKRIKYLSQMDLIEIVTEDSGNNIGELLEETFLELNDLLGDVHDIHEFQGMLGKGLFKGELKLLKREVSKRLFLVNKVSHLNDYQGGIK